MSGWWFVVCENAVGKWAEVENCGLLRVILSEMTQGMESKNPERIRYR